jgi:hypothetical protein
MLSRAKTADYFLIVLGAFALYWLTSFLLVTNGATILFGADTWHYSELSKPNVFGSIAANELLDRIARFHPLTLLLAAGWMKLAGILEGWFTPLQLLKAMFAMAGAFGVAAALAAFNIYLARREAILCTLAYAASFSVWYFSSIEESKIVTASLTALYIARYLRMRIEESGSGVPLLTVILLLGCLNEIVFAFVILLPVIDVVVKSGFHWRRYRWIFLHALAAPLALMILEGVRVGFLPQTARPEGESLIDLFFYYVLRNTHGFAGFYEFAANWFGFNILAPASVVGSNGYFQPLVANYFNSLPGPAAIAILCAIIAAGVWSRVRAESPLPAGILFGLAVFSLVRGTFFFIFNPAEPLLFSAAVTLAHLLIILVPFAASRLSWKSWLLASFAAVIFINSGLFMLNPAGVAR